MTREEMLHLTGFKQVGEGKNLRAYGTLFGYPVVATSPKDGRLHLTFTTATRKAKAVLQVNKQLRAVDALRKKATFVASTDPTTTGAAVGGFVLGGAVGRAIDGGAATDKEKNTVVLTIKFDDNSDAGARYDLALKTLETALQETDGIEPQNTCPFCNQTGGDTLLMHNGVLRIANRDCLHRWQIETTETLEHKQHTVGHLRGLVGGLLRGIVDAVPALLALHFIDYFVGALFALIPMGTYFGWKLFGGKLSRVTTVFTVLYTFVVALAVHILHVWLVLRTYFPDFQFTILETIDMHIAPSVVREGFIRSAITALIFSAIGIFFAWRMITRTDKHELERAKNAFDEAVTIDTMNR